MATPSIDPLSHNVPIVDQQGFPTQQFVRQWQIMLRAVAARDVKIAELEARIAELEEEP